MKTKIFYIAIAIITIVSCSKPIDNNLDPVLEFVTITDVNFEELLISQGIDSDGYVNQQMLNTDAEKQIIESAIAKLNKEVYDGKIPIEVTKHTKFY